MKKRKSNLFFQLLALLIMAAIFWFSSQSGAESSGLSLKVTRFISRIIYFDFKNMHPSQQNFIVEGLHPFVRKLAHFSVYMLLGMCVYSFIMASGFRFKARQLAALVVCIVYAAFDEFHQSFVPDRSMKLADVMIDSAGSLIGIFVVSVMWILFMYVSGALTEAEGNDRIT